MGTDDKWKMLRAGEDEYEAFHNMQIQRARMIMKTARVFLNTWFEHSHAGVGDGAKRVIDSIDSFLEDTK